MHSSQGIVPHVLPGQEQVERPCAEGSVAYQRLEEDFSPVAYLIGIHFLEV